MMQRNKAKEEGTQGSINFDLVERHKDARPGGKTDSRDSVWVGRKGTASEISFEEYEDTGKIGVGREQRQLWMLMVRGARRRTGPQTAPRS